MTEEQKLKRSAYMRAWRTTDKGKEYRLKYNTDWRKRPENRAKFLAHQAINNAVLRGHIEKPQNCEVCGIGCSPHAHHDDHTKKLDVKWLCVQCHADRHKLLVLASPKQRKDRT